jgi:hypothetical protein
MVVEVVVVAAAVEVLLVEVAAMVATDVRVQLKCDGTW